MSDCPACRSERLVALVAAEDVEVEVCPGCKGMLLDAEALQRLAASNALEDSTLPYASELTLGPCLRCSAEVWQARGVPGAERAGAYACGACGVLWLLPGELDRLRAHALNQRRRSRQRAQPSLAAPGQTQAPSHPEAPLATGSLAPAGAAADLGVLVPADVPREPGLADAEPFDRVSFEHGAANWIAAPSALVLALVFCQSGPGRFFGPLIAMPFHELGHALASWLSSRFAVPLPFFTVWHEEQSTPFGLLVAALIMAFGARSWLERRRFGVALALVMLALQLVMSWLVPARLTLMLQILGGALGEIVLGTLLLVAFHFPLPDRLRWDFWRWPALVPASICLAHALSLWWRASRNVRYMPWGAAIGDESDGDMNRLVNGFGWRAHELASFFMKAAILGVVALAASQAWAWHRSRRVS